MRMKAALSTITLVLLLFSCGKNDRTFPPLPGESIEIPVSVEISKGKRQTSRATDHEWAMEGTCQADRVMLLVFKGAEGATQYDVQGFNYIARKVLTCREAGGKRIARGSITGEANATYAVFAIAYNDSLEKPHFTIADTNSTLEEIKIRLIPAAGGARPDAYRTPEFFVGYVTPPGNDSWVFTADGEARLGGTLYRAVGKCTFTIRGVPANIQKVAWITDEMTDYCNVFNPNMMLDEYPIGFPGEDKQLKKPSEVASVERGTPAESAVAWDAFMGSFFIPLENSLFYIDATDDNGNVTRHLVKCPDRWEYTDWIGIVNTIVSEYKFSVAHNWLIEVSGTYDQLNNSGNMVIDLAEANSEYDGGVLPPVP